MPRPQINKSAERLAYEARLSDPFDQIHNIEPAHRDVPRRNAKTKQSKPATALGLGTTAGTLAHIAAAMRRAAAEHPAQERVAELTHLADALDKDIADALRSRTVAAGKRRATWAAKPRAAKPHKWRYTIEQNGERRVVDTMEEAAAAVGLAPYSFRSRISAERGRCTWFKKEWAGPIVVTRTARQLHNAGAVPETEKRRTTRTAPSPE